MGFWHTLCPLCGVAPNGGPQHLAAEWRLDEELPDILPDFRQQGLSETTLDDAELLQILKEGFDSGIADECYLPAGYGYCDYSQTCVGIGYWDEGGEFCVGRWETPAREKYLVPDGKRVGVLRLANADGYGGKFNTLLERGEDGQTEEVSRRTYCDPVDSPCLFFCERCYYYLAAWLDTGSLPSRGQAFPDDLDLSFPGELYEIINSRKQQRGYSGTIPEIEYDGVDRSLDQCQEYVFPGCWKDSRHTAAAIAAGLRGEDLLPAIMRDSRVWMFMRPNVWPRPPRTDDTPRFVKLPDPGLTPPIALLPLELLIPILAQLPLTSLFALSSTCRSLRNHITHPPFLDQVLKEAITRGSLRWTNPVGTVPRNETNNARKAFLAWMSFKKTETAARQGDESEDEVPLALITKTKSGETKDGNNDKDEAAETSDDESEDEDIDEEDEGGEDPASILTSPSFPRLAFIHACWDSDSMMNRKRLWGQVKRFEVLWRDYRTNGWQEQVFYPSAELDAE